MVTFPPGPGAAASSRERSCPVLEILMATPLGFPLLSVMFPPLALRRRAVVIAESAEEACTGELIATASFTELNVIAPPSPAVLVPSRTRPVVASIGESFVCGPAAVVLIARPFLPPYGPPQLRLAPFAVVDERSPCARRSSRVFM